MRKDGAAVMERNDYTVGDMDTPAILTAIENLRREVRESLSEHKDDDTRQFTSLSLVMQSLRDDNSKFKGFVHALVVMQGIITLGMAVVEFLHIYKH